MGEVAWVDTMFFPAAYAVCHGESECAICVFLGLLAVRNLADEEGVCAAVRAFFPSLIRVLLGGCQAQTILHSRVEIVCIS